MHDLIITKFHTQYYISILQDKRLKYFYVEDQHHHSCVGQVYYGTVVRVIAGTQSAFVEIGQERTAFLHLKDCFGADPEAKITQVLSPGQNIIVQVIKDPIGTKGARLSTDITLPSAYLVYQPYSHKNGISQKITDLDERARLQSWMSQCDRSGLIARTVAQNVSEADLDRDYKYLLDLWSDISKQAMRGPEQRCLWSDWPFPIKIMRDFIKIGFSKIYINNTLDFQSMSNFLQQYFPESSYDLILQQGKVTAFSMFKIGTQFLSSMQKNVTLKSGGSVVIEQTESMVTVDVNTSGYVGKKSARDTILRTNLEAIDVLSHQIPLRELGGLIVIDFIDMENLEDREKIHQYFLEKFKSDLMPTQILPMSAVGLVQMTRKKTTESSAQKYMQKCPCCHTQSALVMPSLLRLYVLEALETISARPDHVVLIRGRQDFIQIIKDQEELWKSHSLLQDIPWKYESISGYHNQVHVTLCSEI